MAFKLEKEKGLHGWFSRNKGKGWINCKTGGPCGRESAKDGGSYPACRPTKSMCNSSMRKKVSSKRINWKKKTGLGKS